MEAGRGPSLRGAAEAWAGAHSTPSELLSVILFDQISVSFQQTI